ncbi:MAG: hypothetical protein Q7T76_08115 [Ferruginibacter sp.]|nr:hypothetical protein [Ferruginibacter sp.]
MNIKHLMLSLMVGLTTTGAYAQNDRAMENETKSIRHLITLYSEARENRDTGLLKKILTADVDQLVSTGEWRMGIGAAVDGMLKSSATAPGSRSLQIEYLRKLTPTSALVDCKYEIENKDGSKRKMWSSFLIIKEKGNWRISAIRNMLPASN